MTHDDSEQWERDDYDMAVAEAGALRHQQVRYTLVGLDEGVLNAFRELDRLSDEAERSGSFYRYDEHRTDLGEELLTLVRDNLAPPMPDPSGDDAWRVTVEHVEAGVTGRAIFSDVEMGALRTHLFGRGNNDNPWGRALQKLKEVIGR